MLVSTHPGGVSRWALPTNRDVRLAGSALAAYQRSVQARATQAPPQRLGINLDRTVTASARYTGNLATLGHSAAAYRLPSAAVHAVPEGSVYCIDQCLSPLGDGV
jgi:hypothetical protein